MPRGVKSSARKGDTVIKVRQKGDFSKALRYMANVKEAGSLKDLDKYAREGVEALAAATPVRTGLTAKSWYYNIKRTKDSVTIEFLNSNIQNGVPIAIILFYGHGTRNGGYVQGVDYINPAIQPIFERIKNDAWKELSGK